MRRCLLLNPLLALLGLGTPTLAADACTIVVTARAGDTCATISNAAGITVSQFLRANPGITTCGSLVIGTRYCVDPNFAVTTSSAVRPTTGSGSGGGTGGGTGRLEASKDGQCGNGVTCAGSAFGDCCSEHGWCGSSADHCGSKCQVAFGRCGGGGGSQPVSNVVSSTTGAGNGGGNVAATTTVYVTTTRLVTIAGAGTATQIVRQTVPVTVTVLESGNNGGVATATSTAMVTQTQHSLIFITSTVTTIRTITITDAKQCRTMNITTLPRATGVVKPKEVEGPVPLQPGVVAGCEYRANCMNGENDADGI